MISLHSYGQLVLFPWGWTDAPSPNDIQLQTLGAKFGYYTGYHVCQTGAPGCIYQTDGTVDDWAYGKLGVAAYTFEMGTDFFQSCSDFNQGILTGTLSALMYAVKAARRPYLASAGPEVIQLQVDKTLVVSGTHVTLTATGDNTRYGGQTTAVTDSLPIAAARYTVDAPSWITSTTVYTMTAADHKFNQSVEAVRASVDTSGWSLGRHSIFVEAEDAAGRWGVPTAIYVDIVQSAFAFQAAIRPRTGQGSPGNAIVYSVLITNTGATSDTYLLSTSGGQWQSTITTPTVGPIKPGTTKMGEINVLAPVTVTENASDTTQLTIASARSPKTFSSLKITSVIQFKRFFVPQLFRSSAP